jgi:hypothetical protein
LSPSKIMVAPPAGAWIETFCEPTALALKRGRAPRGRVD